MAFLLLGAAVAGAVYIVLGPFLQPLLWAVLCGSVLHPFKHKLTVVVRSWLHGLRSTGTPLTVGLVVFPIGVVDRAAETVGGFMIRYAKALVTVTVILVTMTLALMFTPTWVVKLLILSKNSFVIMTNALLCVFDSLWVWTVLIAYVLVVMFYWTPNSSQLLCQLSIPCWAMLLLHLVAIIGCFRIPIFIFLLILMGIGFYKEVSHIQSCHKADAGETAPTISQTAWALLSGTHQTPTTTSTEVSEKEAVTDKPATAVDRIQKVVPPKKPTSAGIKKVTDDKSSNMYLWSLMWACGVVQFYHHLWLLPLFAFPVWYFVIKKLGQWFGIGAFLHVKLVAILSSVQEWLDDRKDALFPAPLRGVFKLVMSGDRKVMKTLDGALDTFMSMATIILVIFCTIFALLFFAVQIHAESMHMVQVTSNLINQTVVNNPELQAMLPEGLGEMVDSMLDNAYLYGREWSVNMVKGLLGEQDEAKALHIEKQVMELWDRVYQAWMSSSEPTLPSKTVSQSWTSVVDSLTTPGLFDFSSITSFVKENIGTFMSVLESVWSVLKGNISLAISAFTATLSVLLGGGSALLNFFINFIVFMTALFYLLASSGERYKVVELIGKVAPADTGSKFGIAAEEAINGIFAASFKMAFFYGMWTWLIHNLFGVKIVYIPSALAATFGAVPFLGTYWAALPAVLELWLVQDNGLWAVLMFVCQLLPMSFVDTAIYSEIKGGGHPYLTGLSIAGGIFCLGVEGALIGPILLCSLIVAVNMGSNMMQDSPVSEPKRGSKHYFKRTNTFM